MSSIEWVSLEEKYRWDSLVSEFDNIDIYYSSGYSKAFENVSEGKPYLVFFSAEGFKACNVVLLREIKTINGNVFYDLTSQYGYGGWVFQGQAQKDSDMSLLFHKYEESCISKNIISEVIRLHPVCCDFDLLEKFYTPRNMGAVVVLDTSSEEIIWKNIISKNRNVIRKAEKLGVIIKNGGNELITPEIFKSVYDDTMSRANAADFYFFSQKFHNEFNELLEEGFKYFAAYLDDVLLGVAIITHKNGMLNYHLSGTTLSAQGVPAMNLLLYRAAVWGAENGYKTFNLGGGVGASRDSLFKFKQSFTKDEPINYYLLTKIFNERIYQKLTGKRVKELGELDESYFPKYRAPQRRENKQ